MPSSEGKKESILQIFWPYNFSLIRLLRVA